MFVHYNKDTLRVTGITTFKKDVIDFISPTIDILSVVVDKPLNEYIVSLDDKIITWAGKSDETILSDLVRVKEEQRAVIRKAFNAEVLSTILVNNIMWFGGDISVTKLDGAKRLNELGGSTTVTFYDVYNLPHILTILEAEDVILAIGIKYQQDFSKKQSLFNSISASDNIESVLGFSW